ncbi:hypothetical protein GWN42_06175 [candidate division KSB1 bacterium]|nr:hypothetical protein [candidate division KSB1 bacterium]
MNTIVFLGILSAYALWPTVGTIEYRQDHGQIPQEIGHFDAFVAVDDCSLIGSEAKLITEKGEFRAMVFDCAGGDGAHYFSDGNDMTTPYKLAGDVDYHFWQNHPELVGSLVTIEVTNG